MTTMSDAYDRHAANMNLLLAPMPLLEALVDAHVRFKLCGQSLCRTGYPEMGALLLEYSNDALAALQQVGCLSNDKPVPLPGRPAT